MPDRRVIDPDDNLYAFVTGGEQRSKLVIFIHGFDGDYIGTWGDLPYVLKEFADTQTILLNWDYLFIGFETVWLRSSVRIADELSQWIDDALVGEDPFEHPYEEIALVGHSLGTLIVRHCILSAQCRNFATIEAVTRAIVIGQPVFGTTVADFLRLLTFPYLRKPVLSELTPGNGFVEQMRRWGHCATADAAHPLCKIFVYDISSDIVSNLVTAPFWAVDQASGSLPGDHIGAVKVYAFTHPLVAALIRRLA